jgi:hypothetical protein
MFVAGLWLLTAGCSADQDLFGARATPSAAMAASVIAPVGYTVAAGGPIHVINEASGGCLDVWGEKRGRSTPVGLWTCVAGPQVASQRFTVPAVGATSELRVFDSTCVADRRSTGKIGAQVEIVGCTGVRAQRWTYTAMGELRNAATGACLVASGGVTAMTPAVLGACGVPGSVWRPSSAAGMMQTLVAEPVAPAPIAPGVSAASALHVQQTTSGGCLDVWGEKRERGTPVGLWTCVPGTHVVSQRFTAPPAGATSELRVFDSTCVSDSRSTGQAGAQVVLVACTGTTAQRWTYTAAGELRNAATGACLVASGGVTAMTPAVLGACGTPGATWKRLGGESSIIDPPTPVAPTLPASPDHDAQCNGGGCRAGAAAGIRRRDDARGDRPYHHGGGRW